MASSHPCYAEIIQSWICRYTVLWHCWVGDRKRNPASKNPASATAWGSFLLGRPDLTWSDLWPSRSVKQDQERRAICTVKVPFLSHFRGFHSVVLIHLLRAVNISVVVYGLDRKSKKQKGKMNSGGKTFQRGKGILLQRNNVQVLTHVSIIIVWFINLVQARFLHPLPGRLYTTI